MTMAEAELHSVLVLPYCFSRSGECSPGNALTTMSAARPVRTAKKERRIVSDLELELGD